MALMAGWRIVLVAVVTIRTGHFAGFGHMIFMGIRHIRLRLLSDSFKRLVTDETYFARYRGRGCSLAMASGAFNSQLLVKIGGKELRLFILFLFLYGVQRSNYGYYSAKA